LLLIASACFVSSAIAQTGDFDFDFMAGVMPAEVHKIHSAKASLAAYETSLYGRVSVRVSIDETGNVSSVEAVSGPGNICQSVTRADVIAAREAAATAARLVKFKPAKVGEQPITSAGWLYFDMGKPPSDSPSQGSDEKRYTAVGLASDYKGQVQAQTTAPPNSYKVATGNEPRSLTGGVLNGKARSLPKPPYPPAARAVRASGAVTIKVLIGEDGSMFSAEAVSGHPLLRSASRLAACGASFSPTLLDGKPVKVEGIITYNFVSP
jgi:hypothetical protein